MMTSTKVSIWDRKEIHVLGLTRNIDRRSPVSLQLAPWPIGAFAVGGVSMKDRSKEDGSRMGPQLGLNTY